MPVEPDKQDSTKGATLDIKVETKYYNILVLVLDTLHYQDIEEAKKLSTSTIKLLKLLCKSTTVKIRFMNVCPQEENGK